MVGSHPGIRATCSSHSRLVLAVTVGEKLTSQVQAPRYTYLPLLLPQIKENLVSLALDDEQLATTNEAQWWFEEDAEEPGLGGLGACRW